MLFFLKPIKLLKLLQKNPDVVKWATLPRYCELHYYLMCSFLQNLLFRPVYWWCDLCHVLSLVFYMDISLLELLSDEFMEKHCVLIFVLCFAFSSDRSRTPPAAWTELRETTGTTVCPEVPAAALVISVMCIHYRNLLFCAYCVLFIGSKTMLTDTMLRALSPLSLRVLLSSN